MGDEWETNGRRLGDEWETNGDGRKAIWVEWPVGLLFFFRGIVDPHSTSLFIGMGVLFWVKCVGGRGHPYIQLGLMNMG